MWLCPPQLKQSTALGLVFVLPLGDIKVEELSNCLSCSLEAVVIPLSQILCRTVVTGGCWSLTLQVHL